MIARSLTKHVALISGTKARVLGELEDPLSQKTLSHPAGTSIVQSCWGVGGMGIVLKPGQVLRCLPLQNPLKLVWMKRLLALI